MRSNQLKHGDYITYTNTEGKEVHGFIQGFPFCTNHMDLHDRCDCTPNAVAVKKGGDFTTVEIDTIVR